jgi:hypothetical protein
MPQIADIVREWRQVGIGKKRHDYALNIMTTRRSVMRGSHRLREGEG